MCRRLGVIRLAAKPRKAYRDAAADGLAFFPPRVLAGEDDFAEAGWFPRSDMRAVQIDFRRCSRGTDLNLRQAALTGYKLGKIADCKSRIECFDFSCHRFQLTRPPKLIAMKSSIWKAAAPAVSSKTSEKEPVRLGKNVW